MNKFWVMVLIVIVSAIAGAVMFYFSDTCTYWRFEKKIEYLVNQAGGTPDDSYFEPERTVLRESGYLIEFDKRYVYGEKSDYEKMLAEIRSWNIDDFLLQSTFFIREDDHLENVVRIEFWTYSKLAFRIEAEILKHGLIPHSPSQQ